MSALYNYTTHVPYAGFVLQSSTGVASAARSNALSFNQTFPLDFMPVDTRLQVQAEAQLPGTRYDMKTQTVGLTVRCTTISS